MRILLVSKWIDGAIKGQFHHSGEWVETFDLACTFADLGNEVAIVTPLIYPKHVKDFEKEFGKTLKRKKIKHIVAPILLSLGLNEGIFQLKMHFAILRAIREFKPDVVQFMQLIPTFIRFFTKVPIFFYGIVLDFDYPKLKEDVNERLKAIGSRRNLVDLFINFIYFSLIKIFGFGNFSSLTRIGNVSLKHRKGYQKLKRITTIKKNVYFVHKGVNLEKARVSLLSNQTILFTGSITYRKGVFDLLEAFSKIAPHFPKAKLLIAGSGPRRLVAKARSFIKRNRINATLLGSVSYSQKWRLYQKADVFCLPSYVDASPATILEAMASGLPIITTYQADPSLKNGRDAILVNAGDIDTLYTSIVKLLSNPIFADKLGTSVRETAKLYSWEHQAKKLLRLYRIQIN